MKSDLTCPVEVAGVALETREGEGGEAQIVCEIRFLNLLDKSVDSVQMNIVCFDAQDARLGGRLVRAVVREDGERRFSGVFLPEHVEGIARVEASVEKVWFKDGVLWRREERNVREYTPNILPEGRELDRLRAVAGPDAMGYAREEDVLWLCVCGRANPIDEERCFKCRREKRHTVEAYSYATIEATVGKRERDLESMTRDSLRRSSEETVASQAAAQKKRKKRRRRLTAVVTLLALAAAGLAAWRWAVPYVAVKVADARMDEGRAADARTLYAFVEARWPDEFGARQGRIDAETRIAEGLLGVGTEEALIEASSRAQALGADGAALYERAQLALAAHYEETDEAKAEEIYRALGTQEAGERLLALLYREADDAQERLDYETAIAGFAALGGYEDAAERREECVMLYGRQLLREGHYEQATEQFLSVPTAKDSVELARQSTYKLAAQRSEEGDYRAAAELYDSLGAYENAEESARACRYEAGVAALSAGDARDAAEQFALAEGYADAAERFAGLAYELGEAAMAQDDPETAISWFEQLARDEQSSAALNGAIYALAEKLEGEGDMERAAQAFASLGGYMDAEKRARELEYGVAVGEMEVSPESALARFEGLEGYADSDDLALRCRYLIASAAYEAGEYETALEGFSALGKYEDSAARLRRSRYALAGQRREEGKFSEAASLYEACGAYLDAEDLAMRARYDGADRLEKSGYYSAAANAFGQLGSYEDAPERKRAAEDAWLGDAYDEARMDTELGDWQGVVDALRGLWRQELPERYAEIPTLYRQAAMARATQLIQQNKPLDALPLLESISDEPEARERLDAYVYKVIGIWTDENGAEYVFRRDGSCSINGREAYFGGHGYEIAVADTPYPASGGGYVFVRLRNDVLTLQDRASGKVFRLTYVGEPEEKPQEDQEEAPKEDVEEDAAEEAEDAPESAPEADEAETGEKEADKAETETDEAETDETGASGALSAVPAVIVMPAGE